MVSSDYEKLYAPPGITGMGGYRTLTFDVIGQGEGDLKLFHTRFDPETIEEALEEGLQEDVESEISKVIPVVAKTYQMDSLLLAMPELKFK